MLSLKNVRFQKFWAQKFCSVKNNIWVNIVFRSKLFFGVKQIFRVKFFGGQINIRDKTIVSLPKKKLKKTFWGEKILVQKFVKKFWSEKFVKNIWSKKIVKKILVDKIL